MAQSKPLDLFSHKQVIKDIESVQWIEYRSTTPAQEGCCLEYVIPPSSHHYIDLDHSLLKVKLSLSNLDGTPVGQNDKVGLTNNVLNSIFNQVDIVLGDLNISPTVGTNHAYRAFLETLLGGAGEMDPYSRLKPEGYESLKFVTEGDDYTNDVIVLAERVKDGATLSLIGKIRTDGCSLGKFIPNGVDIKIRLNQSSDAFRVTAHQPGNYKVTIKEAVLKVCQVKLTPEELLRQDREFEKGPAVFDYIRSDVRGFQIPAGSYNATFENLYHGKRPLEIITGIVPSSAYAGKTEKNPLLFHNFKLNHIELTVDGVSVPGPPLKPDFEKADFYEAYHSLLKENIYCDISNTTYPLVRCLYRFDLEPHVDEESLTPVKTGNLRINLGFAEALPEGVTVIIYSKFADRFLIDRQRNVYQDELVTY